MAQIPRVPNRSGLGRTPGIGPGPVRFGAEDFGAGTSRALQQLGNTITGSANQISQIQAQKDREQKDTLARNAAINYRAAELEQNEQYFTQYTGLNAAQIPGLMETSSKANKEKALAGIDSPYARQQFEAYTRDFDLQQYARAQANSIRQQEQARQTTLQATVEDLRNDAILNSADNPAVFRENLQKIREINEELYAGQPAEFIAQQSKNDAVLTAKGVAGFLETNVGAAAALQFINSDEVAAIEDGGLQTQFGAIRTRLMNAADAEARKGVIDTGTREAIALIQNGGQMDDVYLYMIENYGVDAANSIVSNAGRYQGFVDFNISKAKNQRSEMVEQYARDLQKFGFSDAEIRQKMELLYPDLVEVGIKAAQNRRNVMTASATAEALQRTADLDKEFDEAGGNASVMPSFDSMTPQEQTRYLNAENTRYKARPDASLFTELNALSDQDFIDRWEDEGQRQQDIVRLGGSSSEYAKAVTERNSVLAGNAPSANADRYITLDSEVAAMKGEVEESLADSGRSLSKDDRDLFVTRQLNAYRKSLEEYMQANDITDINRIPPDVRRRLRAQTNVQYLVEQKGWVWDSTISITAAEAQAAGIPIAGGRIDPTSLSSEYRQNYTSGTVNEIPDLENGNSGYFAIDVSLSDVPEAVRRAARGFGGTQDSIIVSNLAYGDYYVIGNTSVITYDSNGENPQILTQQAGDAWRNAMVPLSNNSLAEYGSLEAQLFNSFARRSR